MARLIDSDSLLGKINDTAEGLADCDQQNAAWALRKYAVRDIMDAEKVDAVEVVRCRDCAKLGLFTCPICFIENKTLQFVNISPDFYCGEGERKDGGGNG